MDELPRLTYENQSQTLRAELKKWENDWAKTHGGDKPARSDIKQNPDIAQKYKHYNKVRDILVGKIAPPAQDDSSNRKRQAPDATASGTPSKRTKILQTPSKTQRSAQDVAAAAAVTPSLSRKLFSPTIPTSIGPTPQKDGRVLGLFDLLAGTPSRSTSDSAALDDPLQTQATPTKQDTDAAYARGGDQLSRTPMSSSRRVILDNFLTPLHRRDGNARPGVGDAHTPSSNSVSKLQFATPAFLRRTHTAPLPAVDENGEWKVEPIRLPRKPHGRGLSSVLASLRRMEEETMDADLDVMREMELEADGLAGEDPPLPKPLATDKPHRPEKHVPGQAMGPGSAAVEVEYSQTRPALLGAFDDEGIYDSLGEEELGRNGQPLRIFKKKGQKRTTRKVNIKPIRMKRPAQPEEKPEHWEMDHDMVPETQLVDSLRGLSDPLDIGSGSEYEGPDTQDDEADAARPAKTNDKVQKREGPVQKAVRKVKATAHANFRRLKLRNYGAKGGPGHNSRFRRRR